LEQELRLGDEIDHKPNTGVLQLLADKGSRRTKGIVQDMDLGVQPKKSPRQSPPSSEEAEEECID
jgi:hypothetical protein